MNGSKHLYRLTTEHLYNAAKQIYDVYVVKMYNLAQSFSKEQSYSIIHAPKLVRILYLNPHL